MAEDLGVLNQSDTMGDAVWLYRFNRDLKMMLEAKGFTEVLITNQLVCT